MSNSGPGLSVPAPVQFVRPAADPVLMNRGLDDAVVEMTPSRAGRLAALLYLVCGPLVAIGSLALPMLAGENRGLLFILAIAAVVSGGVIWFIPWERFGRSSTLWLLPPTFALIASFDALAGRESYAYGVFFFVSFAWIGLSHRPGTALRFAPLAAVAYLTPLILQGRHAASVATVTYVAPCWVLVGEAVAFVSERLVRSQNLLREHAGGLRALFVNSPHPMFVYERATGRFLEVNEVAMTHYGYSRDEFREMSVDDLSPNHAPSASTSGSSGASETCRHVVKGGREIDVELSSHDVHLAGREAVLVAVQDVTERNMLERELRHQAFHDSLTGLANRALFADRVSHAASRRSPEGTSVAVVMLDLDDFKTINDSLGHSAGDALLLAVARRLRECIRASDTAARLGGDEFAILIEDVIDVEVVESRIELLMTALSAPFDVAGTSIIVTASAGIAFDHDVDGPEELFRNSDTAMYRAKAEGKGCVRTFEPTMHDAAKARLETERELRDAITRNELVVYYQPSIELRSGQVTGFEALVRWNHPTRGLLSPAEFIPLAEETGLITGIGRWVLGEAATQAREWQDTFPGARLRIAVNLSAAQFNDRHLVDEVAVVLAGAGIDPTLLTLEMTETAVMRNSDVAIQCLHRLRRLGVKLAIDDFGTGYSSLSYLRTLPVDTVKIDRSFIEGIGRETRAHGVVEAILSLARTLELETVAEGVERSEQAAALHGLGCQLAQGFYYSPPMAPELVLPYLTQHMLTQADPLTA
jgi:diguanylate cyclase (GGDEF)-like protein/PAS domain S-box-containing protein